MEDKEILNNMRDNNDYSYLYGTLNGICKSYSFRKGLYDSNSFNDVFQNAVMAFFLVIHDEEFELTCKLSTFFVQIFNNHMYKHFNSSHFRLKDPESMDERYVKYDVDFDNISGVINNIILDSLDNLPNNQREIVLKMYFDGKNQTEIAEELGLKNTNTIKSQKYKAFKKIKPIIERNLIAHGINDYTLEF